MTTFEEISQRYSYDPETGELWSKRLGRPVQSERAGRNTSYLQIQFLNKTFLAHRVCWLIQTGKWPKGQIDHIDQNGMNNRFSNLRDVNNSANMRNCHMRKTNKSGVNGVYWDSRYRNWVANIRIDGRQVYLGSFKRLKYAAEARVKAAEINGYTR